MSRFAGPARGRRLAVQAHDARSRGAMSAGVAPSVLARATSLLALQRTAGNKAVSRMLGRSGTLGSQPLIIQRMRVGREAMTAVNETWSFAPTAKWEVALEVLSKDVVGHAWISVRQLQPPEKRASVGFWPKSSWGLGGAIMGAIAGPGELRSNDPHDGESDHKLAATIDPAGFRRLINVVDDWATAVYSITAHNCAGFAKAAWKAATEMPGDSIDGLGIRFWTPLGLAQDIDWTKESAARSRAKSAPPPQ